MRMTESGAFLRVLKEYKKFRETKEGKEFLEVMSAQTEDDIIMPAFDEIFINEMQRKERIGLVEPRIYFDTICPNCGRKNPFTVSTQPLTMMGSLMMKAKCPCGHLYLIIEHIVKETAWGAIGCLSLIALAAVATGIVMILSL